MPLDGYGERDVQRIGDLGSAGDDDPRPPFARDYDRLIYSSAFRRLQGKTQVVSPGEADFFRTRLTHTLEVAQVARRLAEHLNRKADDQRAVADQPLGWTPAPETLFELDASQHKVDPDLCEAAAILHDLGHPPYGHAGEDALDDAIRALTQERELQTGEQLWPGTTASGFNGNAQSFRLAVATLEHKQGKPGLKLTRAAVDASLKYPWEFGSKVSGKSKRSWNVDAPQGKTFLEDVRADVPDELKHELTIEAQIMDWADDVAYSVHDLDDWLRAGYMPIYQLVNSDVARADFAEWVAHRWKAEDAAEIERIHKEVNHLFSFRAGPFIGFLGATPGGAQAADPSSDEARQAIRVARGSLFGEFLYGVSLSKRAGTTPETPRRYQLQLSIPSETAFRNKLLKELLWRYVVHDHRMASQQHGQKHVVRQLFTAYVDAALECTADSLALFPGHTRAILESGASPDEKLRSVVDHVSGMTDAYAASRYERLFGGTARLHDFA